MEAAGLMFSRSRELYKMQYTTVFSDGGSKAFLNVYKPNMHDKDIAKDDCVNHHCVNIAKRAFSGIENIKKDGSLGGKGKLTKAVVKKLDSLLCC